MYISVSAATGSGSGMDFRSYPSYVQALRWDLFLLLFVYPHGFFLIFHFFADLIFSRFFPSTFQFLQQPVVEVEWILIHIHLMFKHQGEIFSFFYSSVLMVFFFHFSIFCWFNLFWSFSMYISVSGATGSGSGMDFNSYPSYVQAFPSSIRLSSCFFFHFSLFCWFNLFWSFSMYISVSAATGSVSGMDFRSYPSYVQAPRWDLFLLLFVCPHGCFHCSFFWWLIVNGFFLGYLGFGLPLKEISFLLLNFLWQILNTFFPSTFQFLQQPVVQVEWDFRSYPSFVSASRWNLFLPLFSLFIFFADKIVIGVFFFCYLGFGLPLKDVHKPIVEWLLIMSLIW